MSEFRSLADAGAVDALVARLNALAPDSPRQWGRMTVRQMLCHISDSFEIVTGDRPVAKPVDNFLTRTVVKYIGLHTSLPWMKGAPTMQECDAEKGGTPASDFERDRARAIGLLRAFSSPTAPSVPHPLFGPLTYDERMIWGYRHLDHHLRQFQS